MQKTPNLELNKPANNDYVDVVTHFNENADKLDAAVTAREKLLSTAPEQAEPTVGDSLAGVSGQQKVSRLFPWSGIVAALGKLFTSKAVPATPGNLAALDALGNLGDSGKGLAAFAPSGFGLGEADGKTISSLAEITAFGFYRLPTGLGITPDDASNWGAIFVGPNINYGNLIACRGGYVAVMSRAAGVFGPWEWLNPALTVGVEYRTTERYTGKPVYYKLIDFGNLPNATTKSVAYGDDSCMPLSCYGWSGNNYHAYHDGMNLNQVFFDLGHHYLNCTTVSDQSGVNPRMVVKYWKLTD